MIARFGTWFEHSIRSFGRAGPCGRCVSNSCSHLGANDFSPGEGVYSLLTLTFSCRQVFFRPYRGVPMNCRFAMLLIVFLLSLSACNKKEQRAEQRQSSYAAGSGSSSNGGYLGSGEGGYLATNKSSDDPQASDEGEVAQVTDEELSPPPGDGCTVGVDCCASNEECVATQFAGCCREIDEVTECSWTTMHRDALAAEREVCTRVRCAAAAAANCAADNDGKEAQCVLGRCRLVPFR